MEKKKNELSTRLKENVTVFGSVRALCFAAILSAMSLILGKYLQIPNPLQEIIRISFENTPVIMAGITMGPLAGALVGAVADLIGCLSYGYSINPLVTLGAASVGFVAGVVSHYLITRPLLIKVIAATVSSHIVGSVFIKSAGLAAWYLAEYDMSFWGLVGWRALTYTFISLAECTVLYLLLRNRALSSQIERMCKRK